MSRTREGHLTQDFCLDLSDGKLEPGTRVQIWECFCGNPNQVWTMSRSGEPTSGENS